MNYDKDNERFQAAIELVNHTNRTIFLTGRAGTGKTTFLKYIRENSAKKIVVVAPTGVAAINAAGVTIHSFFQLPLSPFIPTSSGLGFSSHPDEMNNKHSLLSTLRFNNDRRKLFQELQLLIIDEVSMVRADTVDAIDTVLRFIRKRPAELFGGVQVLFIGDLLQLPPVIRDNEWALLSRFYQGPYFFNSKALEQQPPIYLEFDKIYRQKDQHFINLLNQVRNNVLDEESYQLLDSRYQPNSAIPGRDGYIILTTHNSKANDINTAELHKVDGRPFTYEADIKGEFGDRTFPAERTLVLKVGAQVMFIRNDSADRGKRYFNGKIGTVTFFEQDKIHVRCENGQQDIEVKPETWENLSYSLDQSTRQLATNLLGSFTQFPLRLAWAITIHKSQGLTFEKAIIDAGQAFAPGQVYVALSRCTNLNGLILTSRIRKSGLNIDSRVLAFSKSVLLDQRLSEELEVARKEYERFLVFDLFSFRDIHDEAKELVLAISTNLTSYSEGGLQWTESLANELALLESTGHKFKKQLESLLPENDHSLGFPKIRERLGAAAVYFKAECQKVNDLISNPGISTDNKLFAKETNESLKEIYLRLSQKKQLLSSVTSGFTIQSFLESQATFISPPFNITIYGGGNGNQQTTRSNSLFGQLKKLRDSISMAKGLPAYRILPTAALQQMAELLPETVEELARIPGFGETRIRRYGQQFLEIILEFLKENPSVERKEKSIKKSATKPSPLRKKGQTREETLQLFSAGLSIAEIAIARKLAVSTIEGHLSRFITDGLLSVDNIVAPEKINIISQAIEKTGAGSLSAIREITGEAVTFGEIRMVAAALFKKQSA